MEVRNRPLIRGEMAPDFTLKDHEGKDFKLSDMHGKRVLLSFHPLAWTGVCAEQMKALETHKGTFAALNTIAVGISVDSVPTKKAWADDLGIMQTRLLSDFWPHGQIARQYGLFREQDGFAERANVLVNEKGMVLFSKIYEISQLPDLDEIVQVLKGL